MAGFWTGLVHGTLMCGATLAALSLAFPRDGGDSREEEAVAEHAPEASPQSTRARSESPSVATAPETPADSSDADSVPARPEPLAAEAAPDLSPAQAAEESEPAVPAVAPSATPSDPASQPDGAGEGGQDAAAGPAERLPDPIGSDFRRGSDDPPRVPAVSAAPVERHVPRSVAASEEAVPPPALMPGEVPPVSASPDAPGLLAPDPFEPESLALPVDEPAMTIAAPGRAEAPGLDRRPETGAPDMAAPALPVAAAPETDPAPDDEEQAPVVTGNDAEEGETVSSRETAAAATQADGATEAGASAAASPLSEAADDDARQPAPGSTTTGATAEQQAATEQPTSAPTTADGPAPARLPRPAPDLSIPRALVAPGGARRAPTLPQPAAATPPGPDLSDINPGVSR